MYGDFVGIGICNYQNICLVFLPQLWLYFKPIREILMHKFSNWTNSYQGIQHAEVIVMVEAIDIKVFNLLTSMY